LTARSAAEAVVDRAKTAAIPENSFFMILPIPDDWEQS
jgi:hypothetical protein